MPTARFERPTARDLEWRELYIQAFRDKEWKHALWRGSRILRFDRSPQSALEIISVLAAKPGRIRLRTIDEILFESGYGHFEERVTEYIEAGVEYLGDLGNGMDSFKQAIGWKKPQKPETQAL